VNVRLLFILCLVVMLAFLVPIGDKPVASSTETHWSLSGSSASLQPDLRLSALTWEVQGVSSGGEYRLEELGTPLLTGSGCCCVYLPCVLKNH